MKKLGLITARPKNFDEFLEKEDLNENLKYMASRKDWLLTEKQASKAEAVIDKIPTDELPECEQIDSEHCKVGDFIRKETFEDKYDDEKEEILGGLKDGDILAYCWNDITTWWKRRKNNDGDGLVRIK